MNEMTALRSVMFSVLPTCWFKPQAGDITPQGQVLRSRPSDLASDSQKFAAFSDPRLYHNRTYESMAQFLPQSFEIVAPPADQNAFAYVLGEQTVGKIASSILLRALEDFSYPFESFSQAILKPGDIVTYALDNQLAGSMVRHAAVYVGDERVRSRWGHYSPVIEHPLTQVLPTYWNKNFESLGVYAAKTHK